MSRGHLCSLITEQDDRVLTDIYTSVSKSSDMHGYLYYSIVIGGHCSLYHFMESCLVSCQFRETRREGLPGCNLEHITKMKD